MFWDTSDSQEQYNKNLKSNHQQLKNLGYIDSIIEYRFNSHGFRTHDFTQTFDALAFGCSFTMGTGVENQSTWPEQLSATTGLCIANLGHAGSSNDTAFRVAEYYLPRLMPKFALWLQTDQHRFELIDEHLNIAVNFMANGTLPVDYQNDNFIKNWFLWDCNQTVNANKNTLAFKQLCRELDIIPIILPRASVKQVDLARDLMHPGKKSYQLIADEFGNQLVGYI